MSCLAKDPVIFQIAFYRRVLAISSDWRDQSDWAAVEATLEQLADELKRFNIDLQRYNDSAEMQIRGYADILNSIRLRFPSGGFANTCLGHVIGRSAACDLAIDLKRGINRIIFAPEMIEPQGSDKVICHNCGCGC